MEQSQNTRDLISQDQATVKGESILHDFDFELIQTALLNKAQVYLLATSPLCEDDYHETLQGAIATISHEYPAFMRKEPSEVVFTSLSQADSQ